jgi:predicted Rossmann fold nucleotide-binding protein DprA/Smf involved in DNA uptake
VTDTRELLSEDGAVVAMLCSHLGLAAAESQVAPLALKEWNALARRIHDSDIKSPASLIGLSSEDLIRGLELAPAEAERIVQLLSRGGGLALELDHLAASGIWCVTRADESYPSRLRNTLKHQAPAVLFGAGALAILEQPTVAVVGSRDLDDSGVGFTQRLGAVCAEHSIAVVSGGARGTDRISMQAALSAAGRAVGVLADSLIKAIRQPDVRESIEAGKLLLLTPYQPDNGFSIGAAMGRNKVIYGAADYAVIVSSDYQKGGTWAGALETLAAGWCPVFARAGDNLPAGNSELIRKGAVPLADEVVQQTDDLIGWLKTHARATPQQGELLAV